MIRESRSNYIVRKMQESRPTSPEEQKIACARGLNNDALSASEENIVLRNNVKELQQQLQKAYVRIKNLTSNSDQMELF